MRPEPGRPARARAGAGAALLGAMAFHGAPLAAADGGDEGRDRGPAPSAFVAPVLLETGPVIAPARPVLPSTRAHAGLALSWTSWNRGRAEYESVAARVTAGGAWSPWFLPRLEIGGDLAVLLVDGTRTSVPPAIDEWATEADLGEMRLHAAFLAWVPDRPADDFAAAVTPHLRFTLPTDTSRFNASRRHSALRRVLGADIRENAFLLVDAGATAAVRWRFLSAYESAALVFGAVFDGGFRFLAASSTGVGARIGPVECVVEIDLLGRATAAPGSGPMIAMAVAPALRYAVGGWVFGVEARFGLDEDAAGPYGDAGAGVTARYEFGEANGSE